MPELRKPDRRTLYTRNVIKDALLELTVKMPYGKVSIASLCKQAQISRSTFYLHYSSLDEVLDSIIDDALEFSNTSTTLLDVVNGTAEHSMPKEPLLPACQRIADSDKYHHLFMDDSISARIIQRLWEHEKNKVVPDLMKQKNISEADAEVLFRFILHGTFAVNRSLGWQKNAQWYHDQYLLSQFISKGMK